VIRSATRISVLGALLIGAFGCGDDRTPLVLYSPHGRDLLTLVEQGFEAKHPGIDVRWLDMGSQEVFDRIRSEAANPQADVWFGGPDTIFSRGAEAGLLAPFRPEWAAHLLASSQRDDDLYFGLYYAVPLLIYNGAAVAEADAPKDWDDLLDERWTGKIVIRDPLASGTMRTVFGMVLSQSTSETGDTERGYEWLTGLDAQTREYVVNPALLFEKLTRQEGVVSIWELTDMLLLARRGSPLAYSFPTSGVPLIDDSIGLVAGARHPEEAKQFIEWVGSRDTVLQVAREVFRLPTRTDLPREELPEWAQDALARIRPAEVDWDLIARDGNDWMLRWDREIRGRN